MHGRMAEKGRSVGHSDDEQVFFPGVMVSDQQPASGPAAASPGPGPAGADAQADQSPAINPVLWLWYLFFQPKRFFEHLTSQPMPFLTVLCAWTYGMAGVIDRIEMHRLQGQLPVDQLGMSSGWGVYLGIVLVGGAFAGLLYYAVGGWWYRKRLEWCGVTQPDGRMARRVYLYASQVLAVPAVFTTLVQSTQYENPVQMMTAEGPAVLVVALTVLGFAFWSVWTSYCGATTMFNPPRRGGARLWFFALPGLIYAMVFAALLGVGILMGAAQATAVAPDLDHPLAFRGSTVRFGYPGNWVADQSGPDQDGNLSLRVTGEQDVVLAVEIYGSKALPEEELALSVSGLRSQFTAWRDEHLVSRWGAMKGVGVGAVADIDDQPYRFTILVVPLGTARYMEIREICLLEHEQRARPGFELIKQSFKISRRLLR